RYKDAITLAQAVARAEVSDEQPVMVAVSLTRRYADPGQALSYVENLLKQSPDAVHVHRAYQDLMEAQGRIDECREHYRDLYAKSPDSPLAGYLRARVETSAVALGLLFELSEKFPNDPMIRRGFAYQLFAAARFEDCLTQYDKLLALDPSFEVFALS